MINLFPGAPFNDIVVIDYETRWSKADYTLSKMTTEEYIRDPRFKAFGASLMRLSDNAPKAQWYNGDELPRILGTFDWSKTAVCAHNAQFDVAIMEWVHGVHPCFIFDTLSMARALYGVEVGNSLAKLAERFGLPPKGNAVYSTDGLDELSPAIERELAEYCNHDTWLASQLFSKMLMRVNPETGAAGDMFPIKELRLIDMTLKMYTRPQLELDPEMLEEALDTERTTRESLLERLKVTDADLASTERFGALLRGMGVEPPVKRSPTNRDKWIPALAKTDAKFQALLNGDNEDVAALCEARLKVKSVTERTRAQRFLDISKRGRLAVPLSYYGASTGRWTASKGAAINMQNLKRGSFLRKAIMAPEGHVLVVGDLSQIEPRVLAWLAGYDELLGIFRSGQDPYAMFGRQMFNRPDLTKENGPELRQSAKSALLGCFGPDTPVLTQRGWVPIVSVQATDIVWDGEEWTTHQGVVPQGEKEVLTALGISATSDHEILTGRGWAEWSEVLSDPFLLKSALSLASSPVSGGNAKEMATTQECAARAGGRGSATATTSWPGEAPVAARAHTQKRSRHAMQHWVTPLFAPTERTVNDFSTASVPSSFVAQTQRAASTLTTAGAASRYISRGRKTVSSFFDTLSALMGGTSPSCSLIGATTSGATNRATFASSPEASTCPTSARSRPEMSKSSSSASLPLKQKMQTYDIAYAGPRNRYTILTDAGPLIVHNCGYMLGWASFAQQLLTGFLGAPPMRYDRAFAKTLGVTGPWAARFLGYHKNIEKLDNIQANCSPEELVVHCMAAARIIEIYRETAYPVAAFWKLMGRMIEQCLYGGDEVVYKCLTFRKEEIVLPSGMSIRYPNLRLQKDEEGRAMYVYGPDDTKLHAGIITNNVTQGVARVVMTDGMLRTSKRYFVAGTVHDEQIAMAPEDEAKEALAWVIEQMTKEPSYLPGIPLAADGGVHRRYGLAKG